MPRAAKAYAIILIPKSSHAFFINYFKPISLCNIFYKLVANRIQLFFPYIIHLSQSGFIK
ncbi:hypothetical protein MA16_Dca023683 [Dendrobium catenatum]|uniref:Reverse transcriptase domain-containing protein n=1 Tax=Dendrobium catenatum TaxID=906689 RepID=A0A2I0V7A8_9ASPA|nr:hypothetical protein MA16_Dca023683 [Dendrobium catenatum]